MRVSVLAREKLKAESKRISLAAFDEVQKDTRSCCGRVLVFHAFFPATLFSRSEINEGIFHFQRIEREVPRSEGKKTRRGRGGAEGR